MAATDEMAAFTDSQLASGCGGGVTKGACAAIRVRNGSMPQGRTLTPAERTALADLIDQWVAGGQMR